MDRITSHAELLRLSGDDPWVQWSLPHAPAAWSEHPVWFDGHIALIHRPGWRPGFWATPLRGYDVHPDRIRAALTWLASSDEMARTGSVSLSVVQPHIATAEETFALAKGGDWHWMWTTRAPDPDPLEGALIALDDTADAAEISEFSHRNNHRVWTQIGTGRVLSWVGLRDESGALIAVGGTETDENGAPSLAGIVTAIERRGQGLGAVITAGLTRRALAEHQVCTLGVFSDNTTAIDLYARLGYRIGRAWSSRLLAGA